MELRNKTLEQIEQFLASEYLSIANVCFFMQSIRLLLEIDSSKSKFKITNHYCNWLLHKDLNRSNSPVIVREIAESFQKSTTKNDLIKKVNDAISIKKLVVELKEILWTSLPNKVSLSRTDHEDYWLSFLQIILSQLLFRPIKLENDISLKDFQFSIYGLQIVADNEHYNVELLSKELDRKNKRFIIDIALFRDLIENTTYNKS